MPWVPMYIQEPAVIWPNMVSPAASSRRNSSQVAHCGTRLELAISTRGAHSWVRKTPTGLPDWTSRVSSPSRSRSDATIASKASQLRAARPDPPYTMSSSGCSATSGSRLFISIRMAASCGQPLQVRSVPRGARTGRGPAVGGPGRCAAVMPVSSSSRWSRSAAAEPGGARTGPRGRPAVATGSSSPVPGFATRGRLRQVVEAAEGAFKRVGEPLAVTGSQQVKHQAGERRLYQRGLAFGVLGLDAVSDQAVGDALAPKRDLLRAHITGQPADRGVQRGGFETQSYQRQVLRAAVDPPPPAPLQLRRG